MVNLLVRTLIIYLVVSIVLRCMGKRQVGELELSDLVATLLLSEVAALPIADHDMPISHAIFPTLLILSIEIILTFLKTKSRLLKKLVDGKPSMLIYRGVPNPEELEKMRISIEELLSECRLQGYSDINDIAYGILEQDGKLSIIPKTSKQPLCAEDIGLSLPEKGMAHPVITDGAIQKNHLAMLGLSEKWLKDTCRAHGCAISEVFLMTVSDNGAMQIYPKEKKR